MKIVTSARLRATVATAVLAGTTVVSSPSRAAESVDVLLEGLAGARGVDVGPNGRVVITEQGSGGDDCFALPPEIGGGTACAGLTGRLLEYVVKGKHAGTLKTLGALPSLAVTQEDPETGEEATFLAGPIDVDLTGRGETFVLQGGIPPEATEVPGVDPSFNDVFRWRPNGRLSSYGDIADYQQSDPDPDDQEGFPEESNPFGVASVGDGSVLVADAANNDLIRVWPNGTIRTVARFPLCAVSTGHLPFPFPEPETTAEAVPTSVTVGPDGAWYVGQLLGFPFTPGESYVWRIEPGSTDAVCDAAAPSGGCSVFKTGFTSIIDIDFAPDGTLYVLEFSKDLIATETSPEPVPGTLWKVVGDQRTELAAGQLIFPGGVAAARGGIAYVTNLYLTPDAQLLRISS